VIDGEQKDSFPEELPSYRNKRPGTEAQIGKKGKAARILNKNHLRELKSDVGLEKVLGQGICGSKSNNKPSSQKKTEDERGLGPGIHLGAVKTT